MGHKVIFIASHKYTNSLIIYKFKFRNTLAPKKEFTYITGL